MKLELENTDDPRNHQFDDLDQIIVLLNNPENGEQFYEILTYVNGDFVFGGHGCELFDFDAPFPGPELMRWEESTKCCRSAGGRHKPERCSQRNVRL